MSRSIASVTWVAITPDGRTAYVTNFGGGTVTPINTATNTAGATIAVGSNPFGVAITPDGRTAYVTNDLGAGTVTPINTATKTPGATIPVGSNPFAVAVTPDQSPSAVFGASSVTLGQATSFDGSASADSDGSVVAYAWSFGDGSTLATASPPDEPRLRPAGRLYRDADGHRQRGLLEGVRVHRADRVLPRVCGGEHQPAGHGHGARAAECADILAGRSSEVQSSPVGVYVVLVR
jgi:YVTN family beta-propeller protein